MPGYRPTKEEISSKDPPTDLEDSYGDFISGNVYMQGYSQIDDVQYESANTCEGQEEDDTQKVSIADRQLEMLEADYASVLNMKRNISYKVEGDESFITRLKKDDGGISSEEVAKNNGYENIGEKLHDASSTFNNTQKDIKCESNSVRRGISMSDAAAEAVRLAMLNVNIAPPPRECYATLAATDELIRKLQLKRQRQKVKS